MKRITHEWLLKRGVSRDCPHLVRFVKLWPNGAEVTLANALTAADALIDLGYFGAVYLRTRQALVFKAATATATRKYLRLYARTKCLLKKTEITRSYRRALAPVLVAVLRGETPPEAVNGGVV